MDQTFDIAANRRAAKWSKRELAGRLLWEVSRTPFFAWTPRQFWGWRRFILRVFGAKIAAHVHVHSSVRIAIPWNLEIGEAAAVGDAAQIYNLGMITIGARATVSQNAHLCAGTHDYKVPDMPLVKATITIEEDAWVCADAFVGPGVTVGNRAVLGARAVAVKDVPAAAIAVGNPARVMKSRY